MIEAREVRAIRGGRVVLKGVSLEAKAGEALAIIGPTGSGKTTLLRILNLLDPPSGGWVLFDGADVSAGERARFLARRRMAMVFQKPSLFNTTVEKNVSYGLRVRGISMNEIAGKVAGALREVGLSGYENRRPSSLSGGEAQRVALARALVTEPDLLLLDEATANLDPRTAEAIEDLISRVRDGGITVVMATHDLDQARELADRVAVLMGGEVAGMGTVEEIFDRPVSEEVARFVRRRQRPLHG
ncbi:ABC transporter ATP-binding protein [Candidatus Methanocrinis natronophilus]|uniref:Molybdate/tungstate import ATP-binding protein WtpC n=1 Tax=Candidatus Methanocrinis natronophilus TaxID=3033396 RepID=A0ABT5X5B0_9EURY|nr:phosphate ABC transporter ATP-binding protein [Candidatus Methanocrinis natronophilus]MDF0589874.1 phosphate ABC transporter ATP-binding protein [Candidatus Methanocrinis natronophilus]